MDEDGQRYMAFHCLKQWAKAVVIARDRIETAMREQREILAEMAQGRNYQHHLELNNKLQDCGDRFRIERHSVLIAAAQLLAHRKWLSKFELVPEAVFAELDACGAVIVDLRNKNEHVIDYFLDKGRYPNTWTHFDGGGYADASATIDDKIGGRLSWNDLAEIARRILAALQEFKPRPS